MKNKIPIKKFIPGIAWFFVVLFIMCLPGKDLPQSDWLDQINFDKIIHVAVFGMLTFLFCYPFSKSGFNNKERLNYFIKITIAISIWGLTIEFIQKFFVPGRSFDLLDWAADSLGALICFFFCRKKLMIKG